MFKPLVNNVVYLLMIYAGFKMGSLWLGWCAFKCEYYCLLHIFV